jgi:hypothetical protein
MLTTLQKATILRNAGIEIPTCPIRRPATHERRPVASATHALKASAGDHAVHSTHDTRFHHSRGAGSGHVDEGPSEHESPGSMHRWGREIDNLFATYAAARAAKSLRDAEAARQIVMLRNLAASQTD